MNELAKEAIYRLLMIFFSIFICIIAFVNTSKYIALKEDETYVSSLNIDALIVFNIILGVLSIFFLITNAFHLMLIIIGKYPKNEPLPEFPGLNEKTKDDIETKLINNLVESYYSYDGDIEGENAENAENRKKFLQNAKEFLSGEDESKISSLINELNSLGTGAPVVGTAASVGAAVAAINDVNVSNNDEQKLLDDIFALTGDSKIYLGGDGNTNNSIYIIVNSISPAGAAAAGGGAAAAGGGAAAAPAGITKGRIAQLLKDENGKDDKDLMKIRILEFLNQYQENNQIQIKLSNLTNVSKGIAYIPAALSAAAGNPPTTGALVSKEGLKKKITAALPKIMENKLPTITNQEIKNEIYKKAIEETFKDKTKEIYRYMGISQKEAQEIAKTYIVENLKKSRYNGELGFKDYLFTKSYEDTKEEIKSLEKQNDENKKELRFIESKLDVINQSIENVKSKFSNPRYNKEVLEASLEKLQQDKQNLEFSKLKFCVDDSNINDILVISKLKTYLFKNKTTETPGDDGLKQEIKAQIERLPQPAEGGIPDSPTIEQIKQYMENAKKYYNDTMRNNVEDKDKKIATAYNIVKEEIIPKLYKIKNGTIPKNEVKIINDKNFVKYLESSDTKIKIDFRQFRNFVEESKFGKTDMSLNGIYWFNKFYPENLEVDDLKYSTINRINNPKYSVLFD